MFVSDDTKNVVKVIIKTVIGDKYSITDDEGIDNINECLKDIERREGLPFIDFFPDNAEDSDSANGTFEDVYLNIDHIVEIKFIRKEEEG